MKKQITLLLSLCLLCLLVFSQTKSSYKTTIFEHPKKKVFNPKTYQPGFSPKVKNLEAPSPGGNSYRSHLMRVKAESEKRYPRKKTIPSQKSTGSLHGPEVIKSKNFGMLRYVAALDSFVNVGGGTPLDNTMAISNTGMLLGSVNSLLYGYDVNTDTVLFTNRTNFIEFDDFASELGTSSPFDPKLLYDPNEDRFVFVFLSGRGPSDSKIIVGFSSSGNPNDDWNIYQISGNPLNNNTWTDYPAISLTNDELFITVNLLRAGEPWQTGFAGTIIWQIDKFDGYQGNDAITTKLWSDIRHNGRLLRNLATVKGSDGLTGPNAYFISNRNFDIQNDSIFLVEVTNTIDEPSSELIVKVAKADVPYGAPPNGTQENASPVTDSTGFDTNDGRVLGSFLHNGQIQFVGNTKNFETGLAGVYHGIIDSLSTSELVIKANVIGDSKMDFGYPNIAYSGQQDCDNEAIIAFLHTAEDVFAGISAIYYSNAGEYSDVKSLKEGENFVNRINGPYERWGDYFGIQRIYNEPGKVWTAGFYGTERNSSNTWFTLLQSPDSTLMTLEIDTTILSQNQCDGQVEFKVSNGNEPYNYTWNGIATNQNTFTINTCQDDYQFSVVDAFNCELKNSGEFNSSKTNFQLYPNPSNDRINLNFDLDEELNIKVRVFDMQGKLVQELINQKVKKGRNLISFSMLPLSSGSYIVTLTSGDRELLTEKIIKQ